MGIFVYIDFRGTLPNAKTKSDGGEFNEFFLSRTRWLLLLNSGLDLELEKPLMWRAHVKC